VGWFGWLLVSLAMAAAIYAAFVGWLYACGRREDARAMATFIPDCIVLVTRLARDPRVPRRRKLLLFALVLRHLVKAGGEPLIRDLWPGPERSLAVILRSPEQ